jgi:purine-binding chemotaxis protein CheW
MSTAVAENTVPASLLATFFMRDAIFALDASQVQEVIRPGSITRIPHAPEAVSGVINLRGKIVTLLDTGLLLGLGPTAMGPESRIFIVEGRGEFVGMLVDRVGEVTDAGPGGLDALPANLSPSQARFFQGLCRSGGRVISVLNSRELIGEARPS